MKKSITLFAIAAAVLACSQVFAQENQFEFTIGGGIESPLNPEDFNDSFNLGFNGQIGAGYSIAPKFALGANFTYNRFGLDEDNFLKVQNIAMDSEFEVDGGNLSIFELTGTGKYYFMSPSRTTNFYILGGPGLAVSKTSDFKATAADTTISLAGDTVTDFMFTAGFGVKHQLNSRWGLFVEGRYSHVFKEDDTSYLPIRVGVVF
jgi:opacity protein-like surface antigen